MQKQNLRISGFIRKEISWEFQNQVAREHKQKQISANLPLTNNNNPQSDHSKVYANLIVKFRNLYFVFQKKTRDGKKRQSFQRAVLFPTDRNCLTSSVIVMITGNLLEPRFQVLPAARYVFVLRYFVAVKILKLSLPSLKVDGFL